MKDLSTSTAELNGVDLTPFTDFIPEEYRFFFFAQAGEAPYRLLAYLSTLFTNETLIEIGVHNGWGSLALGYNRANRVVGYDVDLSTLSPAIRDANPHLSFKEGLAHQMDPEVILASPFIHFDALHDGVYERVFFDFLVERGYKGLLLLDDIHLNGEMKHFWSSITHPKHDMTSVGHKTGTGLVYFGLE